MQFKEPEGDVIVVDCAYDRADIAEAIAWYESRGYTFRSQHEQTQQVGSQNKTFNPRT